MADLNTFPCIPKTEMSPLLFSLVLSAHVALPLYAAVVSSSPTGPLSMGISFKPPLLPGLALPHAASAHMHVMWCQRQGVL